MSDCPQPPPEGNFLTYNNFELQNSKKLLSSTLQAIEIDNN